MQDIAVSYNGNMCARVLFDNGSQTTLIRQKFVESMGWRYTKASYSLLSIGSNSQIIQGKLWDIKLRD